MLIQFVAATIAVLSFSLGDTIVKRAATKYGTYLSSLFVIGIGIIPLIILTLFLPPTSTSYYDFTIAILAGIFLVIGYVLAYKSLETEQVSDTWVFLNIPAAAIVLFGLLFLGESATAPELICVILVFLGSMMVTITKSFRINRALIPALLANLSWTVFVILALYATSTAASSTGLFFLIARIVAFLSLFTYLILARKLGKKALSLISHPNLSVVSAGIFDGIGQAFYPILIILSFIAIGGTIGALEPAIVAILGYFFYKERMLNHQKLGLILSVAAAVSLGLLAA